MEARQRKTAYEKYVEYKASEGNHYATSMTIGGEYIYMGCRCGAVVACQAWQATPMFAAHIKEAVLG